MLRHGLIFLLFTPVAAWCQPMFGQFDLPAGASQPFSITTGPDGALWFTERQANKVGRITTSGAVTEYKVTFSPYIITSGPDGALWFTEQEGQQIGRITTSGVLTEFPLKSGGGPYAITTGPDGALW